MIFTITKDQKIEAAETALTAIEEDVLIACLGRGFDVSSVADDFTSDDPSDAELLRSMQTLNLAKSYLATIQAS